MYSDLVIRENRSRIEQALGEELREYSIPEVDQHVGEISDFVKKWQQLNRRKPSELPDVGELPEPLALFVMNEQTLSQLSFRYWVERHCWIIADDKKLRRFALWPSQEHFLKHLAHEEQAQWERWASKSADPEFRAKFKFIVVKSRQVGATRFGQAVGAHLTFLFKNTRSIIASDEPEKSLDLWRLWDDIYENLGWWMKPLREGRVKGQEHFFPALGSQVVVGAGNQKTSLGQGLTVDFFHITEVSSWLPEVAKMLDKDLFMAFDSSRKSRSVGLVESTAEGGTENWFHVAYQVAKKGLSSYKSLFIGWFLCPDKWAIPADDILISDDTRAIAKRIERQNPGLRLTKEQLAWYQTRRAEFVAKGDLSTFLQECPSDDEEAFQFGVQSIFPAEVRLRIEAEADEPVNVRRYYPETAMLSSEPVKWDGTVEGKIVGPGEREGGMDGLVFIWEPPTKGFRYYIGLDASHGKDYGDGHSIQVVRGPAKGFPAMQVAEWRGICSPDHIDALAKTLGELYRDNEGRPALLAPDTTPGSPAEVCLFKLLNQNYQNLYVQIKPKVHRGERVMPEFGIKLNVATRPVVVAKGVEAIKNGDLKVNSLGTLHEMNFFVKNLSKDGGSAKIEHADGHHDDRLFALFIAYYIATEPHVLLWNDEELRFLKNDEVPRTERLPKMQELLGVSPREWMARWEAMNGL